MSWTLCTSGSAIAKAGTNANSTIIASGSTLAKWSDEAEGYIVTRTHIDFRADYSSLPTDVQNALSNVCSSLIAIQIVSYDMAGYTRLGEAVTIINVHDNLVRDGFEFLKDFKKTTIRSAD